MRNKSWDSLKAFAIELVRKKTKAEQKKSEPSLKAFVVQLAIFTALVVSYFFLVLSFLSHWLKEIFDQDKLVYALVAWGLICPSGCGARDHRRSTSQGCRIEDRLTEAEWISPFRDNTSIPYTWRSWGLLSESSGDSLE